MKQLLHKSTSILMAFVVLFSTMSFTVDMHFCGDTLVDSAVFEKAKGCGMEVESSQSILESSNKMKGCCSNKQSVVDGQDELQLSINKISFEKQIVITSFVYSYINSFIELKETQVTISEYPPPISVRQIYKLDESYLI